MMLSAADMTKALIAFDTTSRGSNLALIDFAQSLIEQAGGRCRRTHDASGAKANLFATFGPDGDGGIVLSGHTDVVPVDGQDWSSDPFDAVIRDGKLFGRGACDMKGFIGAALSLLPEIARTKLERPLHLALSYDEEVGCVGVTGLLDDLKHQGIRPGLAIIGEPTEMKLGTRHKGCYSFLTKVTGKDGHSSQTHRGVNAIAAAAEIAARLVAIGEELRDSGPHDHSFDPPYCTLNLGRIHGGTAVNIIARECALEWDFRPVPNGKVEMALSALQKFIDDDLLPRLKVAAPEAAIVTKPRVAVPPLIEEHDGAAEALLRLLTGQNDSFGMSFATEAGQFQSAGLSAIVCGPGSIRQAHQPDEFILKDQLVAGEALLRRVIDWAEKN